MPWLLQKSDFTITPLEESASTIANSKRVLELRNSRGNADKREFTIADMKAHIYFIALSPEMQRRIISMAELDVSPLARMQFAWPLDYIVDEEGSIVGYLTNAARKTVKLSALLSSNESISYDQRICIAKNLCVALNVFHLQGLVFGNLTLDKVYVDPESCRVFLDPKNRAQFRNNAGELFPCTTGVPEYLAPEIHRYLSRGLSLNKDYSYANHIVEPQTVFSKNTDLFSLGIIVFALLNGDKHPLSCIISGTDYFGKLSNIVIREQYDPRPMAVMMGALPATSLARKCLAVPNYRFPWCRLNGAGAIFDKCFGEEEDPRLNPRPTPEDWHALLERKSRGLKARFLRSLSRIIERIKSRLYGLSDPVSDFRTRNVIANQYPPDMAGSEPLSSPRVFWRTTILFAMGVGLCGAALILVPAPHANILVPFLGSILGMLIANLLASKRRGLKGYRSAHYAASFICAFLTSGLFGFIAGGAL